MALLAGVDGCRGGWVVVMGYMWPLLAKIMTEIFGSFQEVLEITEGCDDIADDMPIGLPDARIRGGAADKPQPALYLFLSGSVRE